MGEEEEEVGKKQRRQGPLKQKEWHDFLTRFFFITLVHVPPRPAESLKYHNQIKTREIKQETKRRPFLRFGRNGTADVMKVCITALITGQGRNVGGSLHFSPQQKV